MFRVEQGWRVNRCELISWRITSFFLEGSDYEFIPQNREHKQAVFIRTALVAIVWVAWSVSIGGAS